VDLIRIRFDLAGQRTADTRELAHIQIPGNQNPEFGTLLFSVRDKLFLFQLIVDFFQQTQFTNALVAAVIVQTDYRQIRPPHLKRFSRVGRRAIWHNSPSGEMVNHRI